MGSFVLLALAIILAVIAYKILEVRFGDRWVGIGKFCAALAVALVILVIAVNWLDDILEWSRGRYGWAENGFLRFLFGLAFIVLGGLWAYFAYRDRNPER